MNNTVPLPFLEHRTYLHGTTLFDTLMCYYAPESRCVFKVSRMIFSNAIEFGEKTLDTAVPSASLSWHTADGTQREIHVWEKPMCAPLVRNAYDEERIVATGEWSPGRIHARPPEDESLIRCAVALHKALLKREVPHSDPGQWLFTRLELPTLPTPGRELTVTVRQTFGGAAALSDIANEHGPVGSIFFSWLKK